MPRLAEKLLLLVALAAIAAGCKPKVGDDCRISTDCSAAGDRLCDITAPGGYCTVFGCEPGTCPEDESLCVEFGEQRSPYCEGDLAPSPYARTFCMATCDSDSDCRGGYVCADLSVIPNDWGALRIDNDRGSRACLVPASRPDDGSEPEVKVCDAANASDPQGVGGSSTTPGAGGDGG